MFEFNPIEGLNDEEKYPQKPASGSAARQQFMDLFNQIKDYINTDVILDAWMLMDMVMYQKINKWDYLMCITKDILGEYTIVSKELLMQPFEIIESTIKEKMITRASYGYNVKDGQFHAIKIKYDKIKG